MEEPVYFLIHPDDADVNDVSLPSARVSLSTVIFRIEIVHSLIVQTTTSFTSTYLL
jgi:hypothetical protein